MKDGKASRAMEHLDDALIEGAMDSAERGGIDTQFIRGRRKTMKQKHLTAWIAVAAALVLVASVGFLLIPKLNAGPEAVIALDVNPSIELDINKTEKITAIRPLNTDAETVIGEMELKGVDLEVGINAIIGSMLKNGYITADRNSILISVDSTSAQKANAIREQLATEVDALLSGSNISASVITQEYDRNGSASDKAEQNQISPAKATLISKIVDAGLMDANGVPYTYEVLAQLKVNELKLVLESKALTVDGIQATGTASPGQYIAKEEALAIALTKAGLTEADLSRYGIEMDFDDDFIVGNRRGAMVYEVEFHTATMKYEYELLATDGTVLEEEIKEKGNGNGNKDENETFPSDETHISRNEALAIAYADAGVTQSDVKRPKIETDREKGISVYEIDFKVGKLEYEYTIHAVTGEILEREVEDDD